MIIVNIFFKVLPLCLLIGSGSVFSSDFATIDFNKDYTDASEKLKRSNALSKTKPMVQNMNSFVNLEIHEVIINDINQPFATVNELIKSTTNSTDLERNLQTLGTLQTNTTLNLNSVPTNQSFIVENSYTNRHIVKKNNEDNKKSEIELSYNNGERSNSYLFKLNLERLLGGLIKITLDGQTDTDYVLYNGSINNDTNLERTDTHKLFKQTSAVNLNEYAIISYDVKSTGSDNKTRENRFLIVKITDI